MEIEKFLIMEAEKKHFLIEIEVEDSHREKYYEYCSTVDGLLKWFVDDAEQVSEKIYQLVWNQQVHYAKIIRQKLNKYIKFEFLNENQEHIQDPSILDFSLEKNEMTETWYFIVQEYSDFQETEKEFNEDWQELAKRLESTISDELV